MDKEMKFDKQQKEVREKIVKANGLLKYMNGVGRGMEVNTTLMLYKSLIRAISGYGSMIYYDYANKEILSEEMEKIQFQELRTAMGYRMSTPKNVILEEAKVSSMRERAIMLAKGSLAKIMTWRKEELKNKIIKMERHEMMERLKTPRGNRMVINEAWRKVRKDREIVKGHNGYDIYNEDYWRLTERIKVELSIGEERRKGITNDEEMLEKIMKDMKWKKRK